MSRVPALVVTVAVLVVAAGCLGGVPAGTSSTPSDSASTVPTTTEPNCSADALPENVTAADARDFALDCELSQIPDDPVSSSVETLERTAAGFYVRAHALIGTESGASSAIYFVGNDTATRVSSEYVENHDYFHSEDPDQNENQNLYVLNFGRTTRQLDLSVRYLDNSSATEVFDHSSTLEAGAGQFVHTVTMRTGAYSLTATTADGANQREQFTLSEARNDPLFVVVAPDGTLQVFRTSARSP